MSRTAAAATAAILYAAGVVVLFGLRSWQQKRAKARPASTDSLIAAGRPNGRSVLRTAVLVGLDSPLSVLLGLVPVLNLGPATAWIGLVPALCGLALAMAAQQAMGRSWRIGARLAG